MDVDTKPGRLATGGGGVRILRPLNLTDGPTGEGIGRGLHAGAAIDVETTALDVGSGKIIELAIRRFAYDANGVITGVDRPYQWREDPGEALSPQITALTGLTDADVAGQAIEEDAVVRLLQSVSFVVAHNARFDRSWVEDRLPEISGLAWCCSMAEVDWRARGFDGKVLGYLLVQAGFYHCGHRASADVDALIQMLRTTDDEGRTALAEMIERAGTPSWVVRARGASFAVKDCLKSRGYRWDAKRQLWWLEVGEADLEREQWWLAANVYTAAASPKALGPDCERVTARERFR